LSYNYSKNKDVNVTPRLQSELNWTFNLVDKIRQDPVRDPEGYWRRMAMEEKASNDIDDWERYVSKKLDASEEIRNVLGASRDPLPQTKQEEDSSSVYYTLENQFQSQMGTIRNKINRILTRFGEEKFNMYGKQLIYLRDLIPDNYCNDDLLELIIKTVSKMPVELIIACDVIFQTINEAVEENPFSNGDN